MSAYRGRFAPTPSGRLHLGNVRTALIAWLEARRAHGQFILRIEDIDPLRCKPEYAAGIIEDLRWLGLDWDEGPDIGGPYGPYVQSERRIIYRNILDAWKRNGRVYPCTCSRQDILLAGAPHEHEEGSRYPGICRTGSLRPGRPIAWRFRAEGTTVPFEDARLGPQTQTPDDFVVWRADDWPSYQLAVVVDDVAMQITHVVRGDDLLGSTGKQILLIQALAASPPRWYHVPLWRDESGQRLAKRTGRQLVVNLRAEGSSPENVWAMVAHSLGWNVGPRISLAELLDSAFRLPERTS